MVNMQAQYHLSNFFRLEIKMFDYSLYDFLDFILNTFHPWIILQSICTTLYTAWKCFSYFFDATGRLKRVFVFVFGLSLYYNKTRVQDQV